MERKVVFKSNEHKITGILEASSAGSKRPGILMLHGLTNTKEDCPLIEQVKDMLYMLGYATFRFDFFGSGESDGQLNEKTISEMVRNAKDALSILSSDELVEGESIGLWGRSVGGLVAAMLARDNRIGASVLVSAPIFPYKTFYPLYSRDVTRGFVPLPLGTVSGSIKGKAELSRDFFVELEDVQNEAIQALRGAHSILVIHGDQDRKVNPEYASFIYDIVEEPKKLLMVKGAGHDYSGQEEQVLSAVSQWFSRYIPTKAGCL